MLCSKWHQQIFDGLIMFTQMLRTQDLMNFGPTMDDRSTKPFTLPLVHKAWGNKVCMYRTLPRQLKGTIKFAIVLDQLKGGGL